MSDLSHLIEDFPLLRRKPGQPPLHFLDSAASAQKPQAVLDAMDDFYRSTYANVHRGAYHLSVEATERFEQARQTLANFIGSDTPEQIVLTAGTTTALNMVAQGWGGEQLRPDDVILLTQMEHHANLVPWQMVAKRTGARMEFIPLAENYTLDLDRLPELITERVAVIAVTGMSNVLGTIPPLSEIAQAAHQVGAMLVVDAAQLAHHRSLSVEESGADFIAFSGHKLLGPTGVGVLWGRPERLEEMEPFQGGGEMISDVQLRSSTWAAVPHRFEAGTPPIVEAVGMEAALNYLDHVGMEVAEKHNRVLTGYAMDRLADIPELQIYGPPITEDRGGVLSFTLADIHPHDLATILDQEGVAIRAGHHCAKPLMRHLGVSATARASFSVYSTEEDVDALVHALGTACRLFGVGGRQGTEDGEEAV